MDADVRTKWSRREVLKAGALGAASLAVAAQAPRALGAPFAQGAPPRVNASVKIGYLRNIGSGPVFLAIERGYYREVGLNVESIIFQSGTEMVAGLGTGELAAGHGALNPGLYNAWARDIRALVVAAGGSLRPGYGSSWFMVRSAVADQIRDITDLRGRRVSASTEGSVIDFMVRNALRQNGMTLNDVELVRLASPDTLSAFRGGALDAGGTAEAFATQISDLGLAVKWKNGAEITPGEWYAAYMVSDQVAREPDLAVALTYAYLRGVRDFMYGQKTDPAVMAILAQYSGVDVNVIARATPTFVDVNGEMDIGRIRAQQEFWVAEGVMPRLIDPTPFVPPEFAATAVNLLGRATNPPSPS